MWRSWHFAFHISYLYTYSWCGSEYTFLVRSPFLNPFKFNFLFIQLLHYYRCKKSFREYKHPIFHSYKINSVHLIFYLSSKIRLMFEISSWLWSCKLSTALLVRSENSMLGSLCNPHSTCLIASNAFCIKLVSFLLSLWELLKLTVYFL